MSGTCGEGLVYRGELLLHERERDVFLGREVAEERAGESSTCSAISSIVVASKPWRSEEIQRGVDQRVAGTQLLARAQTDRLDRHDGHATECSGNDGVTTLFPV